MEHDKAYNLDSCVISKYDHLIKKYSAQYGFDWLLIASQIYQESCFDEKAKSHVGAIGLMQLMPQTARELGFLNCENSENNINAGIKYLSI